MDSVSWHSFPDCCMGNRETLENGRNHNGISKHRLYFWKELGMLGMVKGSTIQCKNIGRDIGASFKNLVGGEMKAYTEMMNEARDLAIHRMIGEAEQMGADAVVNVRFATSAIIQGAAEVIAYGTAVKFIH